MRRTLHGSKNISMAKLDRMEILRQANSCIRHIGRERTHCFVVYAWCGAENLIGVIKIAGKAQYTTDDLHGVLEGRFPCLYQKYNRDSITFTLSSTYPLQSESADDQPTIPPEQQRKHAEALQQIRLENMRRELFGDNSDFPLDTLKEYKEEFTRKSAFTRRENINRNIYIINNPDFLTVQELADMFGIQKSSVYNIRTAAEKKGIKLGDLKNIPRKPWNHGMRKKGK